MPVYRRDGVSLLLGRIRSGLESSESVGKKDRGELQDPEFLDHTDILDLSDPRVYVRST